MITIDPGTPLCTLINVYTVAPALQDRLVAALEAATNTIKQYPGFLSASIHASDDGMRVVNYAQWTNEAALQAMLADQTLRPHIDALKSLVGGRVDHHVYQVVHVATAPGHTSAPVQGGNIR